MVSLAGGLPRPETFVFSGFSAALSEMAIDTMERATGTRPSAIDGTDMSKIG